mgnify:FL=1
MTKMTKAQLVDENIALRHNIDLLEQQLASLRAAPQPQVQRPAQQGDEDVVATYTKRDGSRWNKVRIGYNMFAHRPARVFHVVAGKYDGDEENCKFADVRYTLEEAEALLLTVRDYPWSRIETA